MMVVKPGNHTISPYNYDFWLLRVSSNGELIRQNCIGGIGDEGLQTGLYFLRDESGYMIDKLIIDR